MVSVTLALYCRQTSRPVNLYGHKILYRQTKQTFAFKVAVHLSSCKVLTKTGMRRNVQLQLLELQGVIVMITYFVTKKCLVI